MSSIPSRASTRFSAFDIDHLKRPISRAILD